MGMIISAGFATLVAGVLTAVVLFANGMRSSPGEFVGGGLIKGSWIAAAFLWGIVAATSALAQEHKHKPEHSDLHHKFYKTWMMPDNRNMSCCSDKDCEPSASKYENGSWYASRNGEWIKVPNHKVETERDSPDGQSHYCGLKIQGDWQSYCFLPASGS